MLVHIINNSRTCLAWRGFTRTQRRRSTGQQPRTKSGRGPADNPDVNWSSTARCVPRIGLHGISFIRASEETSRRVVFDARGGKMVGCLLGAPTCRRPTLPRPPRPAPLCPARPAAVRRPTPPHPWYVRVLGSTIIEYLKNFY